MSSCKFDAVVFDADGTLFDTERLARDVWLSVAQEMGSRKIQEHYMDLIGRNHEGIVARLKEVCEPGFPLDQFLTACTQRTRATVRDAGVPVKEGAREVLELLARQHIPAALATSSGAFTTGLKLNSSGLAPYFQVVFTGDMVSRGKPDPEIYLAACQALRVPPERALAVEDSPNGIRSAAAAGMQVVMIPDLIPFTPELAPLLLRRFDSLLSLKDWLMT